MEASPSAKSAPTHPTVAQEWAPPPGFAAPPPPRPGPLTAAFSVEMRPLAPGAMNCSTCLQVIAATAGVCPYCRCVTSADGIYRGPKRNAPGAESSAVYAVIGLVFFGVIMGPMAIVKGSEAKRAIANDPRLKGADLATFGQLLGIVDVALFLFVFFSLFAR